MEVRLQKDQATRATLEVVHRPLEGIGGMSLFFTSIRNPDNQQHHRGQLNLVYQLYSHHY